MTKPRSIYPSGLFVSAILLCVCFADAQQRPTVADDASSEVRLEKMTGPASIQKANKNISDEANFGSLGGRVVFDTGRRTEQNDAAPTGIRNVKVMARRVNAGFANFFFERISSADGSFLFPYLRPGKYTIEIDRASLPATWPAPKRAISLIEVEAGRHTSFDIQVTPQREITGVVFLDKDGDGVYKPGKDEPVEGAQITAVNHLTISDKQGSYILRDLPAGRLELLVKPPQSGQYIHVALDMGPGSVRNRVVNVAISHSRSLAHR
ncbi:MAG: collagen binding domain-containing protein [Pyrinomonadaceae bacterium]